MKNRYSALTLQYESTTTLLSANSRYEYVVLACKEIAAKVIYLKPKQKKYMKCVKTVHLQEAARLKDNQLTNLSKYYKC